MSWNLFWPNLSDLLLMNNLLKEGAVECATFITQIIVRIPWIPLTNNQVKCKFN